MLLSINIDESLLNKVMEHHVGADREKVVNAALGQYLEYCAKNSPTAIRECKPERIKKRWIEWDKRLKTEICSLYCSRETFKRYIELTNENLQLRTQLGSLDDYIVLNYSQRAPVTIRRLMDAGDNSISLAKLIKDIEQFPELIAGEDDINIDLTSLDSELEEAKKICEGVKGFTNSAVAHHSKSGVRSVKYSDLDEAIDSVGSLFKTVHLLLTEEHIDLDHLVLNWGWIYLFRTSMRNLL